MPLDNELLKTYMSATKSLERLETARTVTINLDRFPEIREILGNEYKKKIDQILGTIWDQIVEEITPPALTKPKSKSKKRVRANVG